MSMWLLTCMETSALHSVISPSVNIFYACGLGDSDIRYDAFFSDWWYSF